MSIKTTFYSWTIRLFWIVFLAGIFSVVLYVYLVKIDFAGWFGSMPSLERLENPKSDEASELYTADGVLLGKYFRENRSPVEYEHISPNMINALLATEDVRFHEHSGIDLTGLFRVLVKSIFLGQSAGGGSTISQQLAKNLFETRSSLYEGTLAKKHKYLKLLINKTKEWITSVQLEREYTKKRDHYDVSQHC